MEDFLYQIGCKLDASYEIPANVNQSMSYAGIRILSNLNEIIPPAKYGCFDSFRGNIEGQIMETYKDFPKYHPTEKEVYDYEKYYSRYRASKHNQKFRYY